MYRITDREQSRYEGLIRLSGDESEANTYLGGELERIRLGGEHRVRVFVDEPGYATRIPFWSRQARLADRPGVVRVERSRVWIEEPELVALPGRTRR
jgi:hypothetical protein